MECACMLPERHLLPGRDTSGALFNMAETRDVSQIKITKSTCKSKYFVSLTCCSVMTDIPVWQKQFVSFLTDAYGPTETGIHTNFHEKVVTYTLTINLTGEDTHL